MKKFIAACIFGALMTLSVPAMAQQAYDFSDIEQPFLKLPFEVTNVEVIGEYGSLKHIYHVAESFDNVVEKIDALFAKGEKLGQFMGMGLTKQLNGDYQMMFGYRNEHHFAMIRPDGAGCVIEVDAMPTSFVSGVFDISVYDYVMPDGSSVSVDKFDEE